MKEVQQTDSLNEKRHNWVLISISIIAILAVIAGIFYYISSLNDEETNSQILVYVNWHSHNEYDGYWANLVNDKSEYIKYREDLIKKIKLLDKYDIPFNWQTDYSVLDAIKKWDDSKVMGSTNGKNLVKWMQEDMKVSIDPHLHPAERNYADIAKEISDLGVEPSNIVGGYILYKCGNNGELLQQIDWMKDIGISSDGLVHGKLYNYSWKPVIVPQAAMQGHAMDVFYSGVWKPSKEDFFKHDASGEFVFVGPGYSHTKTLIGEKTSGGTIIPYDTGEYILELISKIESGGLPKNKMYTADISVRDSMMETSYEELESAILQMEEIRKTGKIIYADYQTIVNIWEFEFNSEPNMVSFESFSAYPLILSETEKKCSGQISGNLPNSQGSCGDSICEGPENSVNCAVDCGNQNSAVNSTVQGSCGDEICQDPERQNNVCPEDCS